MDRIGCIFFEGNDSKLALFEHEKGALTLLKAESIDTSLAFAEKDGSGAAAASGQSDMYNYSLVADESSALSKSLLQKLNEFFRGEDLNKLKIIPVLAEPAIYFQKVNSEKDFYSANAGGNGKISAIVEFCDLYDNTKLAVYPSGKSSYLEVMDSLARMNSKRFLRMPAVKSAEISLAAYVGRKNNFDDGVTSLILYVGKEYSKIIFLRGKRLLHIGSTLSVGKNSFNAHNVIVRKILLEMENVAVGNVENIILCGEDDSEELVANLKQAYPRSQVSIQYVESVEFKSVLEHQSAFVVPAAVVEEYVAESERQLTGINLLPQYIKDEQKAIQLDWQGYIVIALILLSTAFFSMNIASRAAVMRNNDSEIARIKAILDQNRQTLDKIKRYQERIQNVDKTKAVLSQLSSGTGIVSAQLKKLSGFASSKGNLWISQVVMDQAKNLRLSGYTFSRVAVKDLSDSYENAVLQNIIFDPLKDSRAFKFSVNAGTASNEKKK